MSRKQKYLNSNARSHILLISFCSNTFINANQPASTCKHSISLYPSFSMTNTCITNNEQSHKEICAYLHQEQRNHAKFQPTALK